MDDVRYRCLDLRRQQMHFNIILRHRVVKLMRRYLEDLHGFVEVKQCEENLEISFRIITESQSLGLLKSFHRSCSF